MLCLKAVTLLVTLLVASSTGLPSTTDVNLESSEIGTGFIRHYTRNLTPVKSVEIQPPPGVAYDEIPLKAALALLESTGAPSFIETASREILSENMAKQGAGTGDDDIESAPRNRRAVRFLGLRIPFRTRPQVPRSPGGRSPASVPKSGGSPPASPPKKGFTPESPGAARPESPARGGPKSEKGVPAADTKPPGRKEGSKGSFPGLDDALSAGADLADLADFFAGGQDSENPKDERENNRKSPSSTTTERSSPKPNKPHKGPGNFHPQGHFHPKGSGHLHSEGHFHPEGPGNFHPGGPIHFPDDDWHGW